MSKLFDRDNLWKDLGYAVNGTICRMVFDSLNLDTSYKILEVASGSGKLGIYLAIRGHEVWQMDIDPDAAKYSIRLQETLETLWDIDLNIIHMTEDFFQNKFEDNYFDLVFCEGFVHHFNDERRQKAVNEMARVSRKLVCIIGSNGLSPELMEIARTTKHTYLGMPESQVPHSPKELAGLLMTAGLKDVKVFPVAPVEAYQGQESFSNIWNEALLIAGVGKKYA